jgi:hypothetical protein
MFGGRMRERSTGRHVEECRRLLEATMIREERRHWMFSSEGYILSDSSNRIRRWTVTGELISDSREGVRVFRKDAKKKKEASPHFLLGHAGLESEPAT